MKYLFFLLTFFAVATAHSQCSEFDRLLREGDSYLKKPNYQEAINSYTAAIIACSGRAGEAKQRITRMVNEINKLKENAVAAEKQAKKAKDEAQTALANLEKANASTVALLLENAERDILNLRYEDALQKIKAAASLGALKPEVAKAYLEISFWYGETGNLRRSATLLDSIAGFTKNTAVPALLQQLPADTTAARNRLREAMKTVDAPHFDFLYTKKYYPDMVPVQGGKFMMGCDSTIDRNCINDETLHEQEVSSFHIARTETNIWQFALYCAAEGKDIHGFLQSVWSDPGDNPVVYVAWDDAVQYANWVSKKKGMKEVLLKNEEGMYAMNLSGGYRLPTEAEWEYAAKGGNQPDKTVYSGSNNLDSVGWNYTNSGSRTRAVGQKKANGLGLYDMSGNAREWCWDWYEAYPQNPIKDYDGASDGSGRVLRGGSWINSAEICRTANRDGDHPDYRAINIGFRLVFVP